VIARVAAQTRHSHGKLRQSDEQRFHGEDVRARSFQGRGFRSRTGKAEQLKFLVHGPVRSLWSSCDRILHRSSRSERGDSRSTQR
jgi:hypothetical protein